MQTNTFTFKSSDEKNIFSHQWQPDEKTNIKAVVQIAHGMAEHSARYERFAKHLTDNNFGVYANDHRGHGKTAGTIENLGYFADSDGWDLVVNDMALLTAVIKNNHPETPVFLLGHSMGSFLSRDFMFSHPNLVNGVILSATACDPGLLGNVGVVIAKLASIFQGKKNLSPMLDKLSFGNFNKAFKPNRTDFDWLSRDNAEVDKYINDPFCGTIFTSGFFSDLLKGIKKINYKANIEIIPKDLPIYLLAGSMDPVGDFSKGVKKVFKAYEDTGIKDLSLKFYEDSRHEILNEVNRKEVYKDIIDWLEQHLP